jgi:hypothetical protein
MDYTKATLLKAVECGNPENDGGFLIPAGQVVTIVRRVKNSPDRVIINAPMGFSVQAGFAGVQGECSANDLGPAFEPAPYTA